MTKPSRGPSCDPYYPYQVYKPHPGGRAFTCKVGGERFSMTPPHCMRARAHSKGIYYAYVLAGRRAGKPVIFEYDKHGNPVQKLTCAPEAKRNYYQLKDTLFFGEYDKKNMERFYPQLRFAWDSVWMRMLTSDFVAGPGQTYKIGQVIRKIEPSRSYPGAGMVELQPVLRLGKAEVILGEPRLWRVRDLNDTFAWYLKRGALMQMAAFSETVLQIIVEVTVSRGSGALGKYFAKKAAKEAEVYLVRKGRIYAARKYLEKKLNEQLRKKLVGAAAAVGKATWAFANEFARYYASGNAERVLVQQADQDKLNYGVVEPAITRASAAFVTTLISDALGAGLDALFEKSETINTKVGKYIRDQIAKIFTTHWISGLIMAVAQARADYLQGKAKSVSAALPGHLVAHFGNLFTNEVKGAATWLAKAG